AMGAGAAIGFAKKVGKGAVGATYKGSKWVGGKAGGRIWKAAEDRLGVREGVKGAISAVDRSKLGWAARWAIPSKLRGYSENLAAINVQKKGLDQESSVALMDGMVSGRFAGVEAAAAMSIIKDRGDGEDVMQAYMRKFNYDKNDPEVYTKLFSDKRFLQDKHMLRALEVLEGAGMRGKALRNEPRLARIGIAEGVMDKDGHRLTADEAAKKRKEAINNIIKKSKPSDVATWEQEVVDDDEVMESAIALGDENVIRTIGSLKGGVARGMGAVDRMFSRYVRKNNLDPNDNTQNWQSYMDHLTTTYGRNGYVEALKNNRMQSQGWHVTGTYLPEKAAATSPGAAAISTPPSSAAGTPPPPTPPPPPGRKPGGSAPPQGSSPTGQTPQGRSQYRARRTPPSPPGGTPTT
ncbi:MAG: hypothetical protein PHQ43_14515, partial [Dehalococcoidales bacterium]|nr:hypothetical protein [Dehalococcoidales bacterium]